MDPTQLLPYLPLIGAALAALLLLLRRLRHKREQEEESFWRTGGSGFDQSQSPDRSTASDEEWQAQVLREQREKEDLVRRALKGDELLVRQLSQMAGVDHSRLRGDATDQSVVEEIARRLSRDVLQIFKVAATQQDIKFNLQTSVEREPVNYPTGDIQPEQITDLSQLTAVMPDQLMKPPEQFYADLAQQQLQVMQPYERRVRQPVLEIIKDVSGSMDEPMSDGMSRHVWARGVTISQLMQAVRGQAKYFLRDFDGQPHGLLRATTEDEATQVVNHVLNTTTTGGGTNIFAAFEQAVTDIRTQGGDLAGADILLISDGQDSSMEDTERVRGLLGKDIRLHVAMIGSDNESLRKVATTYKRYE